MLNPLQCAMHSLCNFTKRKRWITSCNYVEPKLILLKLYWNKVNRKAKINSSPLPYIPCRKNSSYTNHWFKPPSPGLSVIIIHEYIDPHVKPTTIIQALIWDLWIKQLLWLTYKYNNLRSQTRLQRISTSW